MALNIPKEFWRWTHFPAHERTLFVYPLGSGKIQRTKVPGTVLGVHYVPKRKMSAAYTIPEHIKVHAFGRDEPLTGSKDRVRRLHGVGSYYYSTGEVCMGPSSPVVLRGEMTPEEAFWNSAFPNPPRDFFRASAPPSIITIAQVEQQFTESVDMTHWTINPNWHY